MPKSKKQKKKIEFRLILLDRITYVGFHSRFNLNLFLSNTFALFEVNSLLTFADFAQKHCIMIDVFADMKKASLPCI